MPDLDVSDILLDPDFADTGLLCERNDQAVGDDGMAGNVTTPYTFTGVVTAFRGDLTDMRPDGAYVAGSILIYTPFRLRMAGADISHDIVTSKGKRYIVKDIGDYSTFGNGFVWAVCEPVSFSG